MNNREQVLFNTIKSFLTDKKPNAWQSSKDRVETSGNEDVAVLYWDDATHPKSHAEVSHYNEIFHFDRKTGKWHINNHGYCGKMSVTRINVCLNAAGLEYMCFISKGRFCMRNWKTQKSWICGDGKVTSTEVSKAGI